MITAHATSHFSLIDMNCVLSRDLKNTHTHADEVTTRRRHRLIMAFKFFTRMWRVFKPVLWVSRPGKAWPLNNNHYFSWRFLVLDSCLKQKKSINMIIAEVTVRQSWCVTLTLLLVMPICGSASASATTDRWLKCNVILSLVQMAMDKKSVHNMIIFHNAQ